MPAWKAILPAILLLIGGLSAYAADAQPPRTPRHGRIPSDPDYWRFHRWYLNHSVLDVYVNGAQPAHLGSVLKEIEELKQRKVLIRDIVVIGGNNFPQLDASTRQGILQSEAATTKGREALRRAGMDPLLAKHAELLGLSKGSPVTDIAEQLQSLGVRSSPVWVVTYHGRQYVFEGTASMTKFFSRKGSFRGRAQ